MIGKILAKIGKKLQFVAQTFYWFSSQNYPLCQISSKSNESKEMRLFTFLPKLSLRYKLTSEKCHSIDVIKCFITHYYRIRERGGSGQPPYCSFEDRWRNIDKLYIILKGIIWRFRFVLKFLKIFWFREFFSKFSRNDFPMALEQMSEKIETFKISTYCISF